MKTLPLKKYETNATVDVIKVVVERAQLQGMDLAEMRQRCRILDALGKSNGVLELEDADWAALKIIYNGYRFPVAHKDFLAIADDIEQAK